MESQRLLDEQGRCSDEDPGNAVIFRQETNGTEGDCRIQSGRRGTSYEDAVKAAGYGMFHVRLLLLCGWAVSSDAVEILGISFIIPPATCDFRLSDQDKGWINSSVFIGMMVGGTFWGTLADVIGRRSVLLWSLSINALGGFVSSFAQQTWLFIVFRLISGIGVGGSMPVIFSYFCEFQPKDKRGSAISMLATFWMCGNILAAALAWAVIPAGFHIESGGFSYRSWRLYLALCVLPSFTSVLLFVLMPESPKFYLQKGKQLEALAVFHRIYCTNFKTTDISKYNVHTLQVEQGRKENDSDYIPKSKRLFARLLTFTSKILASMRAVFASPLTGRSFIMLIIYFTLSFGFYGLFMWMPELFKRMEQLGGNPCRSMVHFNSTFDASNATCLVPSKIFFNGFITALSNLPANILTIFIIDRVGRKILLSSSMIFSGISVFFLYMVESSTTGLVMTCLFSGISTIGWNAIDVIQAEIFPTHVRSTASGLLMSVGRIASILGNLVFGQLIGLNCAIPMITVTVLLFIGGLSAIGLPNMTKRDLL